MSELSTWREELDAHAKEHGESHKDLIAWAPKDLDWDKEFYAGFGGHEGECFTAWSKKRVYFPVVYDGAEWVKSAPRDPCDKPIRHVGAE